MYHAIDRGDPYLTGRSGINERPTLIDRLDWIGGWPIVRAGRWASQDRQPGPTTGGATVTRFDGGPGSAFMTAARLVTRQVPRPRPGSLLAGPGDEFTGSIEAGWTRVRDPEVSVANGRLVWPVEAADLVDNEADGGNDAAILLRIPYVDDDDFARLSHVAIWNTRQTEFGTRRRREPRRPSAGSRLAGAAVFSW